MSSPFQTTIEDYPKKHHMSPVAGALQEDLDEDYVQRLDFLAYAIQNYGSLPGLTQNVKAVALLPVNNFDEEKEYNNRLTDFFALWFVSHVLQQRITALEAESPHRSPGSNKRCGLQMGSAASGDFYEVKDFPARLRRKSPYLRA
jgi:hypothetical protein